jgi:hypothetical protein
MNGFDHWGVKKGGLVWLVYTCSVISDPDLHPSISLTFFRGRRAEVKEGRTNYTRLDYSLVSHEAGHFFNSFN